MSERICANCACAMRPVGRWFRIILARWPGLLACISHPESPGQMREVSHLDTCRNFRPRYRPPVRRKPPEPPNDDIRYIALTKGRFAIVDAADFEWLNRYKWQAAYNGTKFYATTKNRRGGNIWMHRMIMKAPKGMVVDHINGNGLDNRRCNLRICTPQQNSCNRRKHADGKSRFIGVSPWHHKWQVSVGHQYVGLFEDEVEAAKARDRKAIEMYGEHARLNFPPQHLPDP